MVKLLAESNVDGYILIKEMLMPGNATTVTFERSDGDHPCLFMRIGWRLLRAELVSRRCGHCRNTVFESSRKHVN